MRSAAEQAFDPQIEAEYLALAAKWLRLAEQAQHGITYVDQLGPDNSADRQPSSARRSTRCWLGFHDVQTAGW
jgi:hypothetical protein